MQPNMSCFCLVSNLGKDSNFEQIQKRIFATSKCCPCQVHEEYSNHLILHCAKTRSLWDLLFTLFGVYE